MKVYVVMYEGRPMGAFYSEERAIAYSQAAGGPGEGHAIGYVALNIDDAPEAPPNLWDKWKRWWDARSTWRKQGGDANAT